MNKFALFLAVISVLALVSAQDEDNCYLANSEATCQQNPCCGWCTNNAGGNISTVCAQNMVISGVCIERGSGPFPCSVFNCGQTPSPYSCPRNPASQITFSLIALVVAVAVALY